MSQVQLQLTHSITVLHEEQPLLITHNNSNNNFLAPPLLALQISTDSSDFSELEVEGAVDDSPRQANQHNVLVSPYLARYRQARTEC